MNKWIHERGLYLRKKLFFLSQVKSWSQSMITLREKCRYSEFFCSVFIPNAGKYGPEKLRIGTLFTQWEFSAYSVLWSRHHNWNFSKSFWVKLNEYDPMRQNVLKNHENAHFYLTRESWSLLPILLKLQEGDFLYDNVKATWYNKEAFYLN